MCYVRLTYPVVSVSLKFYLRNCNTLWMLSVGFEWPPFSLSLLKVFGEICMVFVLNWTSERKCLSESKWNQVFILGGNMERDKQPKRNPPLRSRQHLPSANWPACENQWSHQATAILILTPRAERQLRVLHRKAGKNVERQKMSLLTDTIPVSHLVAPGTSGKLEGLCNGPGRDGGVGWLYTQPLLGTSSFFSEEWPALSNMTGYMGYKLGDGEKLKTRCYCYYYLRQGLKYPRLPWTCYVAEDAL